MEDVTTGLRERKKAATRQALHEAALRLTAEHGPEAVTVEAIADAAGVSRRTFSNYFSGKEEALFHGDAERLRRLLELVRAQPADELPWTALTRAAVRLTAEADPDPAWLALRRRVRRSPGLVPHQVAAYTAIEDELAAEVSGRLTGPDAALRGRVLAATFLTTVRVATAHWLDAPDGPLPDAVRAVLALATPADQQVPTPSA
ncbi:TetR/AcrR family transcriptional regulator [Geodermatophilus sp. SYSU D00815]